MISISSELASKYADYCDSFEEAAFDSGRRYSLIWFEKANIEQIEELLSKNFSEYAKDNDIDFMYKGVEEELPKALNSDWKVILETNSGSYDDLCYYVFIILLQQYYSGFRDGVRDKFLMAAKKFFDCSNTYSDFDNNDDDNDNDNDNNDDDDNDDDDDDNDNDNNDDDC